MRFLALFCLIASVWAESITGQVIKVADGDTLTILHNNQKQRIRLYGIDAPETKQPFGKESGQFLRRLCGNKQAKIEIKDRDRYKRIVGVVYCNGINANAELVKNGLAWAYRQYSKDYINLENTARNKKIGLWVQNNPQAPWDYRKSKK